MNTERSRQSVLYWILGLAVAIIVLWLVFKPAPVTRASSMNSICGNLNQQIEEAKLGFWLPASANNLNTDCSVEDTSAAVKARFTIAPTDLERFLQNTGVEHWQTKAEVVPTISYLDAPFVSQMSSYLYVSKNTQAEQSLKVLVDLSDIYQFTVYIEYQMPV